MNILVIDDDPAMLELLKLILQSASAQIDTAASGKEGIGLTQKQNYDVIILDLMMPEMDGWEVCQRIRMYSNTPILILSALDNPGEIARALDAGADDYLIKPVASGVLLAHLKTILRRSPIIAAQLFNVNSVP